MTEPAYERLLRAAEEKGAGYVAVAVADLRALLRVCEPQTGRAGRVRHLGDVQADILDSLRDGPLSVNGLALDTGRSSSSIRSTMAILKERGLAVVHDVTRTPKNGSPQIIYAITQEGANALMRHNREKEEP
jgi:hypothetical protein